MNECMDVCVSCLDPRSQKNSVISWKERGKRKGWTNGATEREEQRRGEEDRRGPKKSGGLREGRGQRRIHMSVGEENVEKYVPKGDSQ